MALGRLFKIGLGLFNDKAEEIADQNSITELRQQIREAKSELDKTDRELTSIIAQRKLADNDVAAIESNIDKYEQQAIKQSEAGNKELALECAQEVMNLRDQLEVEKTRQSTFLEAETTMRSKVTECKSRIKHLDQELDLVKATESMQRAQKTTLSAVSGSNSKTKTALDSLERIKANQKRKAAELEAAAELAQDQDSMSSLDAKLAAANSPSSSESELERILNQSKR
ncbi:PspA/IM30 family protein [Vibrio sp. S4M6]|uniref:PspA/IM30 family protein n=1 Tax=Vibrio sinus TaxID=2946865 RepID=UPI00202A9997|nr:PspA/IM30 family protein [Vibrio sinus]MCL9781714.1 PspA/IM30 family protein [Vibrio sinus]